MMGDGWWDVSKREGVQGGVYLGKLVVHDHVCYHDLKQGALLVGELEESVHVVVVVAFRFLFLLRESCLCEAVMSSSRSRRQQR